MVNSEKLERDCRRWRAIFDRDVSDAADYYYLSGGCVEGARRQSGHTTISQLNCREEWERGNAAGRSMWKMLSYVSHTYVLSMFERFWHHILVFLVRLTWSDSRFWIGGRNFCPSVGIHNVWLRYDKPKHQSAKPKSYVRMTTLWNDFFLRWTIFL